jgi:thiosulfate/3-mercaptopyruvate sulfurtransferase
MTIGPLVSAEWLAEHRNDEGMRVIDFRWFLVGKDGADEYAAGHIPGAVFVAMADVTGEGPGRHPLPSRAQFEAAMRRAGVDQDINVVVYDEIGGSIASRLWFLLRFFGHEAVAVLDGGLKGWRGEVTTEVAMPRQGNFQAKEPDRSAVVDFDAVRSLPKGVPLLDARLGERYRGEKEPVDPKAGHIPGAISAPYPENLDSNGRFLAAEQLRDRFKKLGVKAGQRAVVYCGSGVNATHNLLAMALAGIDDGRLYEGSWSDWSRRDAPIVTGAEPG